MTIYESISYHIVLYDQGTVELHSELFINNKHIYNIFYMNPNGYIYTYNIIFSYLYSKYVLLIDDDRPVRNNIEKDLKYTNFFSISLSVMDKNKDIYGIILKSEGDGNITCYNNIINSHTIRFCKVEKGYIGYYYSNGASIYRTNELKKVKEYLGERYVAQYFGGTKYRMAYLLLNKMCKYRSNRCHFLFDHIGRNSTLQNRNICSIYMY